MKLVNEESLLVALKAGSASAFDQIYAAYSKMLYIYLYNRLTDETACSDILQDVFVSLWEKREALEIDTSLKSYLYQSVKYKLIDQYRKNDKYQKYLNELAYDKQFSLPAETKLDDKKRLGVAMQKIETFPCRMKEIFMLSRFEHLSVNHIAERLSISPQTVKNQLTKALHILRSQNARISLISVPLIIALLQKLGGD